jgi:hypothetical protein
MPHRRRYRRRQKPKLPPLHEIIRGRLFVAWKQKPKRKRKKRKRLKRKLKRALRLKRSFGPRFRQKSEPVSSTVFIGRRRCVQVSNGAVLTDKSYSKTPTELGSQVLTRTMDYIHPGPPYRTGDTFQSYRCGNPTGQVQGFGISKVRFFGADWSYEGGFLPQYYGPGGFSAANMSNIGVSGTYSGSYGDPSGDGPTVYNRARPKIERADAGVFLAEGRDLPRMLKTTAQGFHEIWKSLGGNTKLPFLHPKKVADQFINGQFGWLPFIGDLQKFYDTFKNSDEYVTQIERDNNQWIRRVRNVKDITSLTHHPREYLPWAYPVGEMDAPLLLKRTIDGHSNVYGITDFTSFTREDEWFVASFKYYLPAFDKSKSYHDDWYGKANRLLALYGARINPSVIYRATPWTWLGDWVTNIGQHITYLNSVAYDNLCSKYAFLMKTTSVVNQANVSVFMPPPSGDRRMFWTQEIVVKQRRAASPFGFNVDVNSLTPRQLTILAALGVSRGF